MNEVNKPIENVPVDDTVIVVKGTYMRIIGDILTNGVYRQVRSPRKFKLLNTIQGPVLDPDLIPNLASGDVAVGVSQPLSTTVISLPGDTEVTHIQQN